METKKSAVPLSTDIWSSACDPFVSGPQVRAYTHPVVGTWTRWEGSRNFAAVTRLAEAIVSPDGSPRSDEELMVGEIMAGMLSTARPIVCPPEQLNAVSDEVFEDLGQALEYAAAARLPFETVFFDLTDSFGRSPLAQLHLLADNQEALGFEVRGVIAGENAKEEETIFIPIIGYPGHPPEEIGMVMSDWSGERRKSVEPGRWVERVEAPGPRPLALTMFNAAAAMEALGESPRPVGGALLGVARGRARMSPEEIEAFKLNMAVFSASAVRLALKVLYLIDAANVDVVETALSRQARRQAERSGAQIAWVVEVKPPRSTPKPDSETDSKRNYSHRFEVRGNFAHYREDSWLFQHSPPEEIRPCPRCGRCRRVWRSPHIKGPADRPLAIKVRRVEFPDDKRGSPAG
jgi:hypothetical protein